MCVQQGPVVRKPINPNPRLKNNQGVYFSTPKCCTTLILTLISHTNGFKSSGHFVRTPHAIPLPDEKTKAHSLVTVIIKGRQQACKGGIVPANTDKILKTGTSQIKTSCRHGTTSSSNPHSETKRHEKAVKIV